MTLAELHERTFPHATPTTATSYPPERRLPAEQLTAYLDRRSYAVIGTTRPDGRPHASMSMYLRRDATFWLPTLSRSIRARNLRDQPWLTLTVPEDEDDRHIVVIIEGPAHTFSLQQTPEEIRVAMNREWVKAWIQIRAERVLSYCAVAATP